MKVAAVDVPPPENTVTEAVPAETMSALAMAAVSCVALTKVVGRSAPFQRTTEVELKLLPFTVSVKRRSAGHGTMATAS